MQTTTLKDYATEVAKLTKGTICFLSPNWGAVTSPRGEIMLDGPAIKGWRSRNRKIIKSIKG